MVSIVPNRFKINGVLVSIENEKDLANFVTLHLQLKKIENIEGPAEFLDPSTKTLAVSVNQSLAAGLEEGMSVECEVRKAPNHFFIIPHSLKSAEKG